MDFTFTEEQELLAESLTECLQRCISEADIKQAYITGEYPMEAWKALAENGFLAVGAPESLGGVPADVTTQVLMAYLINKYGGPLAGYYTLGLTTMRDLIAFGTPKQQQMVLEPYINGGTPMALGMSEPGAGSDSSRISTTYRKVGTDRVINGHKHYNSMASQVDYILLTAKDAAIANPYAAMTMFILPANTPGVRISNLPKLGGNNPCHICEIYLDNVVLSKDMILGKEHAGFKQLMKNFEIERTVAMAGALAAAENAFEDAARYSKQRVQFDKPICENQLIMEKIFEMKMKVELIRNQLYKVAWMIDNKKDVRVEHALLKYYAANASCEVIDDALQVLGGIGLVGDHRIMRYYCDNRSQRIGAGSDQVMIFSTAPQILKELK